MFKNQTAVLEFTCEKLTELRQSLFYENETL